MTPEDRALLRKHYDEVFNAVTIAQEAQRKIDKILAKYKMSGDNLFDSAWRNTDIGFHEAIKMDSE